VTTHYAHLDRCGSCREPWPCSHQRIQRVIDSSAELRAAREEEIAELTRLANTDENGNYDPWIRNG